MLPSKRMISRTKPLILLVAAVVIASGVAAAAVSGSPDIDATLSENTVAAGEETTLAISLVNSGDLDTASSRNPSLNSEVTTARGLVVDLRSGGAPISVTTNRRAVGSLGTNAPTTVSFDVSVDEDAEPGTYRIPVDLDYEHYSYISESSGIREEEDVSRTEDITIQVSDDATFDVVSVDSDARVGSSGTVGLTVQNTGQTTARNAAITLESRNEELTVGGTTQSTRFVDSWESGENQTFQYNVGASDDAETQPYNFGVSVSFDDPNGVQTESTGNTIGITPEPEQEFSLSNASGTLRAGEDGTLEATLTNDGPRAVENVVVNWQSDQSNLSPQESQYAVGSLAPGETTTVSFGVDASDSAREGPRQFDFNVGYRDDAGDRMESDTLEVQSEVEASQDEFALEPVGTTVTAGQSGTINITITNTRDVMLSDISAQLFADSPISTNDDEGFVSELGPGESETLTFSISADGSALEKTYPVSLDFQYEEPDGDTPISDTYQVPVSVTTPSDGGGLPIVAIGAVILLAVLGVAGYARFR